MTENAATSGPVTAISRTAARLSFAGAATFVVLVVALHLVKPGLDPSWRMVSEYEIGRYGWLMQLAFLFLATSCVALFVAIRLQIRTTGGKIGLAFLLVSALGMTIAAAFTADPITASQDEVTTHGNLHALGALGILAFAIAATLISRSLTRNAAWSQTRRLLLWMVGLYWVGLLVLVAIMVVVLPQPGGEFGPDVPIGWPNRLFLLAQSVWLMVVSWYALRLSRQSG